MAWSGSWNNNNTVYTGTYTAPDGSTFTGTWTPSRQDAEPADPPLQPLSNYDPYTHGIGPRVDDSDAPARR
jgi:hypothetical protein